MLQKVVRFWLNIATFGGQLLFRIQYTCNNKYSGLRPSPSVAAVNQKLLMGFRGVQSFYRWKVFVKGYFEFYFYFSKLPRFARN